MNKINKFKQKGFGKIILAIGIPLICVVAVIAFYVVDKGNSYVAKIGDVKISQEDLNKTLNKQYGTTVLDTLISDKVIELEAKKQNVTVSKKAIQSQLDTLASQYGSEEALESALSSNNMTVSDAKNSIKTYLLTKKLIEPSLKITDAELKSYFKENKDTYNQAAQVKASHILVNNKKTAKTVLAKLNNGEDWNKLAKEYSQDSSNATDGGNLGYFTKSDMDENFANAAFSLKVGEISGIVKSSYGYHIIKVTGKKSAQEAMYADVKDQVKEAVVEQKMNENYSTWLSSLYKKYKIENKLSDTNSSSTSKSSKTSTSKS
ncbi:peptidylprolyl isomerase [Rummeliibacillus pycnus]|uniref:peptidylprolyl isomerase n=1 Tax=Rummeliibacillus pycnus TaxID=101070 RepID=UPI000C999502|nr:peptidylprolyl isomerase [Rummeliibacillus pycnus]